MMTAENRKNPVRTIAVSIVGVIVLVAGAVGWISEENLRGRLSSEQIALAQVAASATQVFGDLATQRSQTDRVQSDLATARANYATVQAAKQDLASQLNSSQRQVANLSSQLSSMQAQMCSDHPSQPIDYSSNSSVSASLKVWLEDTQGSIDSAKWETIWNNTKVSIHRLTGKFLWVFIVFYEDKSLGYTKNRTFDVGSQCWLEY